EDRVDDNRRLSGRAVADDQLALSPADVRHRVDRLDAGLQRLLHRLPRDHARRLEFQRSPLLRFDRALAVERVSERIDDATEQRLADWNARHTARSPHRLALADVLPLAEDSHADVVLLEVESDPDHVVLELQHLRGDVVLEPVDAGDAVADLEHGADLGQIGLDVVLLDPRLQDLRDLFGAKLQVVSYLAVISSRRRRSRRPRTLASTRIEPACSTTPPIRSGSTLRVASTGRPDAFSIWRMIWAAS